MSEAGAVLLLLLVCALLIFGVLVYVLAVLPEVRARRKRKSR